MAIHGNATGGKCVPLGTPKVPLAKLVETLEESCQNDTILIYFDIL